MLSPTLLPAIVTMLGALLCLITSFPNRKRVLGHTTVSSIRHMFAPPGVGIGTLLSDRARPNQRLVRAFGITNTFVSPSEGIHRGFVTVCRSLLTRSNKHGWEHLRDLATQAVQVELDSQVGTGTINFGIFIQCVTLRVILVGLLGADASVEDLPREDILIAANHINELWALSKNPAAIPSHLLPQLTEALQRLLPNLDGFVKPVDIVIPAWETFWRVVATTVAYSHDSKPTLTLFEDLYGRPSDSTFKGEGDDELPFSLKNVVDEAMRLHPPSKHIGRMTLRFPFTSLPPNVSNIIGRYIPSVVYQKEQACVQDILRTESIWGPDSHMFNPSRYGSDPDRKDEQTEALSYIFGGGNLRCIGSSWAPMAAAVVSSAIFDGLDGRQYMIVAGKTIGGRNGWDDWAVSQV
ncbi:hypothetical protein BKA70DRAFT_1249627 [Coprinopsis sp. MPI-PUGE-AT-0042]|nr:hypothetical protein BKA70DRAFT_1249627 [Coprinopsis sp. MPI-PUGE-AT-0042]